MMLAYVKLIRTNNQDSHQDLEWFCKFDSMQESNKGSCAQPTAAKITRFGIKYLLV